MSSAFEVRLDVPFDEAVERVSEALREEGFGVLTEIDIKGALKEKIGVDFRKYAILGACNPRLAHRALSARPDVGLLLPCNVTVEEVGDGITVRIVDPTMMMTAGSVDDDPTVAEVAAEAHTLLGRVAASLRERHNA
jgi:uncharacterized protein (DUF302 family)